MITLKEMLEDYSWRQAWTYAGAPSRCVGATCSVEPCKLEDVARVLDADEGENDGQPWVVVARMKDGRFVYLEAGCDYTGWDCQASGSAWVSNTLRNLKQFGLTENCRGRFEALGV